MWKDIQGFEKLYKINKNGEIKSCAKQKGFTFKKETILKQKITKFGYKNVTLLKEAKPNFFSTHRLVALTFIPNELNKPFVNHKDGNKLNNNVNNLEWCTQSENLKHAFRTGLRSMKGENHNNRKLDWKKVNLIRKSKEKNYILAKKFNVCRATITLIKLNKLWIK